MSEGARGRRGGGRGSGPGAAVRCAVRSLEKRYAGTDRPALSGVSLEADPGRVLAVVGESGSGKTTLLRLLAGLEVPDAGTVKIGDRIVAGPGAWVKPERRGVGMVFQDFSLFPHMTVLENVVFGLRSLPRRERAVRAGSLLDEVGLAGLEKRYPHQLSGGQKQRVALARALAPEPELLLLDEPFSNLDAPLKVELRDRVAALLARTRITTILVVHEADDVFHLADRAAVLRDGRLVQVGGPGRIYAEPKDEHVARLFGEINVVPARAVDGGVETPLGFLPCPRPAARGLRVLVRPEDVLLDPPDASDAGAAVVEAVGRRGSRTRIRLRIGSEGEAERALVVSSREPAGNVEVGARVRVTVRDAAFRVLETEDRSS